MAREPNTAAADNTSAAASAVPSKISVVLDLLRREQGATLAELVEATGWLPHTTRAALTGLRKKGHALEKSERDDTTCYRIAVPA
jgi:DNA-binding IclR family transcriptional regulator